MSVVWVGAERRGCACCGLIAAVRGWLLRCMAAVASLTCASCVIVSLLSIRVGICVCAESCSSALRQPGASSSAVCACHACCRAMAQPLCVCHGLTPLCNIAERIVRGGDSRK